MHTNLAENFGKEETKVLMGKGELKIFDGGAVMGLQLYWSSIVLVSNCTGFQLYWSPIVLVLIYLGEGSVDETSGQEYRR